MYVAFHLSGTAAKLEADWNAKSAGVTLQQRLRLTFTRSRSCLYFSEGLDTHVLHTERSHRSDKSRCEMVKADLPMLQAGMKVGQELAQRSLVLNGSSNALHAASATSSEHC